MIAEKEIELLSKIYSLILNWTEEEPKEEGTSIAGGEGRAEDEAVGASGLIVNAPAGEEISSDSSGKECNSQPTNSTIAKEN